jgi:hypothetical protein
LRIDQPDMDDRPSDATLDQLIAEFEASPAEKRIELREGILEFGAACMRPLEDVSLRNSDLVPSVASWLGELANRVPETEADAVWTLRRMAEGPNGRFAKTALERIRRDVPQASSRTRRAVTHVRRTAQDEVHARIVKAASEGRILTYSELETSRGHVGRYLFNISRNEADLGHPPLTAIVVSKSTGRPGDGFLPAMIEIGFARRGESLAEVWKRAVTAVHAYWTNRDPTSDHEKRT